jgi:hypothetical protein
VVLRDLSPIISYSAIKMVLFNQPIGRIQPEEQPAASGDRESGISAANGKASS